VRYRLTSEPMFVHCCHCQDCQRQTGSAFVINALIETNRVERLSGETEGVAVATESGRPHVIHRCPACKVALWSHYDGVQRLSIMETLNEHGHNRGLGFSLDMRRLCGRRLRVRARLERIIVDGTGKMRQLRNTVSLEDSTCGCRYLGFGMEGCARCELTYWREIWLRRLDVSRDPLSSQFESKSVAGPDARKLD
jgi:hypothetical protein